MGTLSAVNWRVYVAASLAAVSRAMDQAENNTEGAETKPPHRRRALSPDDYVAGVLAGDRATLARAITLIESTSRSHEVQAQEVLQRLLPHTGKAERIGITGVPGVGKSTFIESFGCYLVEQGRRVAVLTIDPTSKRSGGSILGDKTRMERLSRNPQAFIRPSAAGQSLGGVARRTRETLLLCEAAGFDTVLVETVGVGQSETVLRSMVDFFLLLLLPGAGDELQGIKKGIIEMADGVLINKADGENRLRAEQARAEQRNAVHCLQPSTPGWTTNVGLCSGLTGEGIPEIWSVIQQYFSRFRPAGIIDKRRQQQSLEWFSSLTEDELLRRFYRDPHVQARLGALRQQVLQAETTPVRASRDLLESLNLFTRKTDPTTE
jgi:LAO/AO transport system kinase